MDFEKFFIGMDCICGKHHSCNMRFVAIEHNAIRHLTQLCLGYNSILVVADENTFSAAGQKVEAALKNIHSTKVLFDGSSVLIPNEAAVERIHNQLPGHDLIVGIGSGVIQDLCKYVSFYSGIPYYVIATAPSMDGYTSTGAAMIMNGMKVTYACKVPEVILADTDILKNAPEKMLSAGLGDMLAKYISIAEWRISNLITGEYYCEDIASLVRSSLKLCVDNADGLLKRDEAAVEAVFNGLVIAGAAMSLAGAFCNFMGMERIVLKFSVTSSPTTPSPLVAPRTNMPFSYSSATERPSTLGSTVNSTSG